MTYYITHSGKRIDLKNISPKDICLTDIAHHLTKICRYGGALDLDKHYSVAQHSVILAKYAKDSGYGVDIQRRALIHDATEAYLGDIVAGLKPLLPDYQYYETYLDYMICEKYNIHHDLLIDGIVKELDTRIVLDEGSTFMPQYYNDFQQQLPDHKPLGVVPFNEEDLQVTYNMFLHYCGKLNIKE